MTPDSERRSAWLNVLNPREKRIIERRRLAEDDATSERPGGELGISGERVRQIENRALEKLRHALVPAHGETAGQAG